MGNAVERVDKAVAELNELTESAEFLLVMKFGLRFQRLKPLAVQIAVLEAGSMEICMKQIDNGTAKTMTIAEFKAIHKFLMRVFKAEMDAYIQSSRNKVDPAGADGMCCVCQERETDVVLPCAVRLSQHAFCNVCITDWSGRDQTCPLCRSQIKSVSSDSYEVVGVSEEPDSLQQLRRGVIEVISTILTK